MIKAIVSSFLCLLISTKIDRDCFDDVQFYMPKHLDAWFNKLILFCYAQVANHCVLME